MKKNLTDVSKPLPVQKCQASAIFKSYYQENGEQSGEDYNQAGFPERPIPIGDESGDIEGDDEEKDN